MTTLHMSRTILTVAQYPSNYDTDTHRNSVQTIFQGIQGGPKIILQLHLTPIWDPLFARSHLRKSYASV